MEISPRASSKTFRITVPLFALGNFQARDPLAAGLDVVAFHRRPSDAVRRLLLPRVARMRGESMVEGAPVNILRMLREMVSYRGGKGCIVA